MVDRSEQTQSAEKAHVSKNTSTSESSHVLLADASGWLGNLKEKAGQAYEYSKEKAGTALETGKELGGKALQQGEKIVKDPATQRAVKEVADPYIQNGKGVAEGIKNGNAEQVIRHGAPLARDAMLGPETVIAREAYKQGAKHLPPDAQRALEATQGLRGAETLRKGGFPSAEQILIDQATKKAQEPGALDSAKDSLSKGWSYIKEKTQGQPGTGSAGSTGKR